VFVSIITAAKMKFITAAYTRLDSERTFRHKEGIKYTVMEFIVTDLTGKNMLLEFPAQESHSKFSVSNQIG
jgi:hypothetical protein